MGNSKREEIVKPESNELLRDLNIIDIKCGANHSIGLTQSGEVYGWGNNRCGQIGIGMSGHFQYELTPGSPDLPHCAGQSHIGRFCPATRKPSMRDVFFSHSRDISNF